jgi:hypothetical protein
MPDRHGCLDVILASEGTVQQAAPVLRAWYGVVTLKCSHRSRAMDGAFFKSQTD